MSIQQINTKIIKSLDKVCTLYKSLDNGMNVTKFDFEKLLDPIVELCDLNNNKSLLCLLLSYYTENDIIRKNKYMHSEPKLRDIIISMLDKNVDISYEELYISLKTLYYNKYEEDYEDSLYKKVKDKVIILNNSRLDKTNCTFYDIMAICDEILYNFMDDYYEEDILDNDTIELYDKLIFLLNTDNCNLVDDKNNTLLIFLLSKYYDGYCREIQYNDIVYSIRNVIYIIINNEKFNWNIINSYKLNLLSMIPIIKKYRTEYMEHIDEQLDMDEDSDDIYNSIKYKLI
jgi:hypothetical protein